MLQDNCTVASQQQYSTTLYCSTKRAPLDNPRTKSTRGSLFGQVCEIIGGAEAVSTSFVLEGGSIHVDGEGTEKNKKEQRSTVRCPVLCTVS